MDEERIVKSYRIKSSVYKNFEQICKNKSIGGYKLTSAAWVEAKIEEFVKENSNDRNNRI